MDLNSPPPYMFADKKMDYLFRWRWWSSLVFFLPIFVFINLIALLYIKVALVNLLIHTKEKNQALEEVKLEQACDFVGKSLKDAAIRQDMQVTVLGIHRDGELISNPAAEEVLQKNDVLIIYGEKGASEAFKKKCLG